MRVSPTHSSQFLFHPFLKRISSNNSLHVTHQFLHEMICLKQMSLFSACFYLVVDKIRIISALLLRLQYFGLIQQRSVVAKHLKFTFCNNFSNQSQHLLVCCELGLHFDGKKFVFPLSEIYLTKLTTG